EAPLARLNVQSIDWAAEAAQTPGLSETPVTVRAGSTESVTWTPTASEGPLFVTAIVKVCAAVPASTEVGWKALWITRATERVIVTEAVSLTVVAPAAAAVAVLDTGPGETEEVTEYATVIGSEAPLARLNVQSIDW